ncbi:GH3 family acyl-acid amido synthetase [Thiolapillus brandeum]|uniref:GH3 middle domain-containing protein n=1 Tax=Thiolapillus brandeum TaxID=1076588 RepID=A0A7U6GGC5_9GAMM|nr:GH3 auxin-responsive promoter family protein [Thiolapillus brandeum]BAO43125.1 conserved hypothetical protein [Thiolapillus brandeum]
MTAVPAWQIIRTRLTHSRRNFLDQTRDLPQQQQDYLSRLLHFQAETDFGREHEFAAIQDIAGYRSRVPLQEPEQLQQWVKRIHGGSPGVLSRDTSFFELTGGSAGGAKYLPYGESGLGDFRRALYPWLDDLLHQRPAIAAGPAYWSISPALESLPRRHQGLPVGLESDLLYFGRELAGAIRSTLAVPPEVGGFHERKDWQRETLRHLLRNPGLRLISVWSPSFLLGLVDALRTLASDLYPCLSPSQQERLKSALHGGRLDTRRLWPQLDTISCWTHGRAAAFLGELQARFPHAHIQPKGLLATEGVVSLPLEEAAEPVLAACSGFYEFLAENGEVCLSWELETGPSYEVVLSNHLGLYRYRLGDRVEVCGWHGSLPMLRFLGRGRGSVDLCGEKLNEAFVARALDGMPGFALLLPWGDVRPCYVCISDQPEDHEVETRLRRNPQYDYARRLGQLGPLQWRTLPDALDRYQAWCLARGQRLGDIKPLALLPDDAFLHYLEGHP